MRRDPTEFRKRFAAWKDGKKPYQNGLPAYQDGTEDEDYDYQDGEDAVNGYTEAKNFIENYSRSQGFKQRFNAGLWKEDFRGSKYDPTQNGKYIWDFSPRRLAINSYPNRGMSNSPEYDYITREVNYPPIKFPLIDNGVTLANDYGEIFSHELGHALDSAIHRILLNPKEESFRFSGNDVFNGYSRSIPILRKSKAYRTQLQNKTKQGVKVDEKNISSFATQRDGHDALPEENYADLIQMRFLANKYKVFDSLAPNLKFTKEHLKQYKKLNVPQRLLNNFSDEDIIWMMNNVANNKTINPLSV